MTSLRALAVWAGVFDSPGFVFGSWESVEGSLPWYTLSEQGLAFVRTVGEHGWLRPQFDWPAWSATAEARLLATDPDTLAHATVEQLAQLLTLLIRRDRFVEGSLGAAYESGLLARIVRRAAVLALNDRRREEDPGS